MKIEIKDNRIDVGLTYFLLGFPILVFIPFGVVDLTFVLLDMPPLFPTYTSYFKISGEIGLLAFIPYLWTETRRMYRSLVQKKSILSYGLDDETFYFWPDLEVQKNKIVGFKVLGKSWFKEDRHSAWIIYLNQHGVKKKKMIGCCYFRDGTFKNLGKMKNDLGADFYIDTSVMYKK